MDQKASNCIRSFLLPQIDQFAFFASCVANINNRKNITEYFYGRFLYYNRLCNLNLATLSNEDEFVKFEKLIDNFEWFYSNYEQLKKGFCNQYVAIKDKRQIDNDSSLEILLKRLNLSNYDQSIAIEYVDN